MNPCAPSHPHDHGSCRGRGVRFVPALCGGLLWLAACGAPAVAAAGGPAGPRAARIPAGDAGTVVDVTDGDTLSVRLDGEARAHAVRLIGVDTPESTHPHRPKEFLALEAKELTRSLAAGQRVVLVTDPLGQAQDHFGRILRYVYLPDGRLLNAELIRQGLGFAFTRYPFRKEAAFRRHEAQAKAAGLGLWAENGLAELRWNRAHGERPLRLHRITNRDWAIEYQGLVRSHISQSQLGHVLEQLRQRIDDGDPRSVERALLAEGWVQLPRGGR